MDANSSSEDIDTLLERLLRQESPEAAKELALSHLTERDVKALVANLDRLRALLKSRDDTLVFWTAAVLGKMGAEAKPAVPDLVAIMEERVPSFESMSVVFGVSQSLNKIDPGWIQNGSVSAKVKRYYEKYLTPSL